MQMSGKTIVTGVLVETKVVHVAVPPPAVTLIVSPEDALFRQVWTLAESGVLVHVGDEPEHAA